MQIFYLFFKLYSRNKEARNQVDAMNENIYQIQQRRKKKCIVEFLEI